MTKMDAALNSCSAAEVTSSTLWEMVEGGSCALFAASNSLAALVTPISMEVRQSSVMIFTLYYLSHKSQ